MEYYILRLDWICLGIFHALCGILAWGISMRAWLNELEEERKSFTEEFRLKIQWGHFGIYPVLGLVILIIVLWKDFHIWRDYVFLTDKVMNEHDLRVRELIRGDSLQEDLTPGEHFARSILHASGAA